MPCSTDARQCKPKALFDTRLKGNEEAYMKVIGEENFRGMPELLAAPAVGQLAGEASAAHVATKAQTAAPAPQAKAARTRKT